MNAKSSASLALGMALVLAGGLPAQTPVATPLFQIRETMSGVTFSIGGKDYGPYHHIMGKPAFSPSYTSWILAAWTLDDKGVFVINGKETPIPLPIEHDDPFFISDDGARYAIYLSATPEKAPLRDYILADGKLLGPFLKAETRPEGASWFAFVEKKEKAGRFLVMGDKTFGPYDDYREWTADPASGEIVFSVQTKGQNWLIYKGKELGPYKRVEFVRDMGGKTIGYALWGKAGVELMIADKKYGPYDDLDPYNAWSSPDRKAWLVRAFRKDSTVIVKDGKETAYDWSDIYPRAGGYMLFASIGGKSFFTDGTKEWGPFWNVFERFIPESGMWAVGVERKKGGDWPVPMIILPNAEYPGSDLRFDGTTFSWLSVDDEGRGSVMRLPAK